MPNWHHGCSSWPHLAGDPSPQKLNTYQGFRSYKSVTGREELVVGKVDDFQTDQLVKTDVSNCFPTIEKILMVDDVERKHLNVEASILN